VTIWHGDARDLPLGGSSVDLIVTSWPYNARVPYDGYSDWLSWRDYWDGLIAPFLAEAFRVLSDGGRLVLITQTAMQSDDGNSVVSVSDSVEAYAAGAGFLALRERFTWVKPNQRDRVATQPELVWIFDKGIRRHMPRDGATSDLSPTECADWTRETWHVTRGTADHVLGHAATFPLALARRAIKLYSFVGDTVLDPFMGAGTTLRAAKSLGRVALGVEQSKRYCRLAASLCAHDA
jgi:site-specific DNA-methyltransferase (adenine-specific)